MPSIYSEVRWGLHRVAQDTRILKLTACPWKWMVGRWNFLLGRPISRRYVSFRGINYRFCFRLCFLVLCVSQVAPLVMEEGPQPWTWRLYTKVTLSTTSMRVSNQPNTKRCTPQKKQQIYITNDECLSDCLLITVLGAFLYWLLALRATGCKTTWLEYHGPDSIKQWQPGSSHVSRSTTLRSSIFYWMIPRYHGIPGLRWSSSKRYLWQTFLVNDGCKVRVQHDGPPDDASKILKLARHCKNYSWSPSCQAFGWLFGCINPSSKDSKQNAKT